MILIIGLIILGIAAAFGALGVLTNMGSSHSLTGDFAILGQHITGLTTGQLFLFGIIVGLVAALGLSVLRGFFARGLASRGLRKELKQSQAEMSSIRAENERIQKELAVEKSLNLSQHTATSVPYDPNPTI